MVRQREIYQTFNSLYTWYYWTLPLNIVLVDCQIHAYNLKDPAERDLEYIAYARVESFFW